MVVAGLWLCLAVISQAVQVYFSLDLTWETGAPNGAPREMIFTNGQFPGPPLIIGEGDDVIV